MDTLARSGSSRRLQTAGVNVQKGTATCKVQYRCGCFTTAKIASPIYRESTTLKHHSDKMTTVRSLRTLRRTLSGVSCRHTRAGVSLPQAFSTIGDAVGDASTGESVRAFVLIIPY